MRMWLRTNGVNTNGAAAKAKAPKAANTKVTSAKGHFCVTDLARRRVQTGTKRDFAFPEGTWKSYGIHIRS